MDRSRKNEKGAILVMAAVTFVALVGIGALALDVGRLLILNTEMHNAADSAALAAAYELDGKSGARTRARAAAKNLLVHKGHFGQDDELLKDSLPNAKITFYCAIGSEYDIEPEATCTGAEETPHHFLATSDSDAHYVKVELDAQDSYTIDLFFLPVLKAFPVFLEDVAEEATGYAQATAGRHYIICNYPPLMICDPYEHSGGFKSKMRVGRQIKLKLQQGGGHWAPGDFAFLKPRCDPRDSRCSPGAMALADYLADEQLQACTPPIVTTEPGGKPGPTTWAVNTRFDFYESHQYPASEYPPAPNVIDYPQDEHFTNRIGDGDWDRETYWENYHESQGHGSEPSDYDEMTRWEVYNWEIEQNKLPCYQGYQFTDDKGNLIGGTLDCSQPNPSVDIPKKEVLFASLLDGKPDPLHLNNGDYPPPQSIPERRLLFIATLSCDALGISGRETVPVSNPDGFAKVFMTEHTRGEPSSPADLVGEFVGWADDKETNYHVEIQLFE